MIVVDRPFVANDRMLNRALESMIMLFGDLVLGPGVSDLVKIVVETTEISEIVSTLAVAVLRKFVELAA